MPFKRHSFGLAFYLGSCSVHHTFVCRILIMDAAIRGGLNVRIADAHGGAIHNVSVPVDSGDDAYEALSRAVENALGGEKIVLYGPPWRSLDAAGARAALEDARTASGAAPPRVVAFDPAQIRGEATHASYEADAAAGRAVEAGVRVPRTLAEAKGWGLVRRESSADAEAGSSPGSGPLQRALGDFATQFRLRRAQGTTRRRRRFGRLQTHRRVSSMAFMFARRWRRGRRQTYAGEAYERAAAARARTRARASGSARRSATSASGPRSRRSSDHAAALTEAHDAVRRRGARHGAAQRDARSASRTTSTCARGVRYHYAIDSVYFSRRWRGGKPPI